MDFHGLRLALLCYLLRLADRKEVYMGLDCNVVTAQLVFSFFLSFLSNRSELEMMKPIRH